MTRYMKYTNRLWVSIGLSLISIIVTLSINHQIASEYRRVDGKRKTNETFSFSILLESKTFHILSLYTIPYFFSVCAYSSSVLILSGIPTGVPFSIKYCSNPAGEY
jgi:hypothetical protein